MAQRVVLLFFTCFCFNCCFGQRFDTVSIMNKPVQLDTFVLKTGYDVDAFIRRSKNDTTFYKAFRSMHLVPYTADNNFVAFDKQGKEEATMHSKTAQERDAKGCRTTVVKEQKYTGPFYNKDRNSNYYTADLFFSLFFSDKPVCNENDIVAGGIEKQGKTRMEKNKYELKQLMFNPGSKVDGTLFMGNKTAIFSDAELHKYNFSVVKDVVDSEEVYIFTVTPKPEYKKDVVYNRFITWFRASDYSILARDYSLSYSTLIYDFEVRMQVRTKQIGKKLYPTSVHYNGNWYVFTKKREHLKVDMEITY